MLKKDLKIVFMGTPDFAVESLRILVENDYNIVGVITMPDKPSGRGHKLQYSAVKKYALEKNLPLLQPANLKDDQFILSLKNWNTDLQIVVAFRMLPEIVWSMPPLGTFNLHGSILPQYRGAAPINWAIMNGERETGVTTFFLTHEIDTGKIIKQEKVFISDENNAGEIYDELMVIGAKLVKQTVDLIIDDKIETIEQEQFYNTISELKAAPKIFKETCKVNWADVIQDIHNHIRGLSPYPGAWSYLHVEEKEPQIVKIFKSEIHHKIVSNSIGSIDTDNKTYLSVACKDGYIKILELQFAGKKPMTIEEILRGYKFDINSYFK